MGCYRWLERGFVKELMCKKTAMEISIGDGSILSGQAGDKILKLTV